MYRDALSAGHEVERVSSWSSMESYQRSSDESSVRQRVDHIEDTPCSASSPRSS